MNTLRMISILALFFSLITSCGKDSSVNEPPEPDNSNIQITGVKVYPGNKRIKFGWGLSIPSGKSASSTIISWNDNEDSLQVPVPTKASGTIRDSVTVDSLSERDYTFNFVAIGNGGTRSTQVIKKARVYGPTYQASLKNREVRNASYDRDENTATVYWELSNNDELVTILQYENSNEKTLNLRVSPSAESTVLDNFSLKDGQIKFSIHSIFLPEPAAIDTFSASVDGMSLIPQNLTAQHMDIHVRGKGIDINNVGESGYQLMYPIATRTGWESEYFYKPGQINLFDDRPSAIASKDFATIHISSKNYQAVDSHTYDESRTDYSLDSFSADSAGMVTIAVPTNSLNAAGWTQTSVSFSSTIKTYHLYEYNYTDPGTWVDIPSPNPDFPTLLFAEAGHLTFANPLPIRELAEGTIIDETEDPYNRGDYTYDPNLIIMPNGDYIAGEKNVRYISKDKGKTWSQLNEEDYKVEHASTFHHDGALYIIGDEDGNSEGTGAINRSTDGGTTWETPVMLQENIRNSPSHVIKTKDRIWIAYEHLHDHTINFLSAPIDSDLMDLESWVVTERQDDNSTGNETDMVLGRDGWPVALPKGGPAVKAVSKSEAKTMFNRNEFSLPGSGSKYSVIYDPESNKWWALTSDSPIEGNIRTGITLWSSTDLKEWTREEVVIQGKSTGFHGFNYPFMQIDGDDIVFVSRTAWENEKGQAQRWHDANMLTFHRIRNFREN